MKNNITVDHGSCLPPVLRVWETNIGSADILATILNSHTVDASSSTRKIFDAEQPNLYAEPLMLGLVIAESLTKMQILLKQYQRNAFSQDICTGTRMFDGLALCCFVLI